MGGNVVRFPAGRVPRSRRGARPAPHAPTWLLDTAVADERIAAKASHPPCRDVWPIVYTVARTCLLLSEPTAPADEARARRALEHARMAQERVGVAPPGYDVLLPERDDPYTTAPCFEALARCAADLAEALEDFIDPELLACRVDDALRALHGYLLTVRQYGLDEARRGGRRLHAVGTTTPSA